MQNRERRNGGKDTCETLRRYSDGDDDRRVLRERIRGISFLFVFAHHCTTQCTSRTDVYVMTCSWTVIDSFIIRRILYARSVRRETITVNNYHSLL